MVGCWEPAALVMPPDGDSPRAGFLIARNPVSASRLPYLLRLPVAGERELVLAAHETWPRGKDVFCYQLQEWPVAAEPVEEVPVEACWRAGAAVHLVLRRRQNRRCLFVWTRSRGRPLIFWRSRRSMHGARPGIRVPQARGLEGPIQIAIDVGERYPWRFKGHPAATQRRGLPIGDYAVLEGGMAVAVVERKTVPDLATSAAGGLLALTLAELSQVPHASVVVEGRLSDLVKAGQRGGVRPGWLLNVIAAMQVAFPRVSWMFAETRSLAEDWAYRWLAAGASEAKQRNGQEPSVSAARGLTGDLFAGQTPRPAGPSLIDAGARRALILREAAAGIAWRSRELAMRCQVTQTTAWKDLTSLTQQGLLQAEGRGRSRTYRALVADASMKV